MVVNRVKFLDTYSYQAKASVGVNDLVGLRIGFFLPEKLCMRFDIFAPHAVTRLSADYS